MSSLPLLLACVVALGLVVWFEVRRTPVARRVARVLASAAVVAILFAYLRLHGPSSVREVLTPGAPVTSRSREAVALERFSTPALLWNSDRDVRLTGWGLLAHEWPDSLENLVSLAAAPLPDGAIALDVPTEVGLGERLVVRGQLHLGSGDSAWVILDDPAGPRDSALVSGRAPMFELTDWPRAATAAEYRLTVRSGGRLMATDTLGIAVRETRPPSVLVIDNSPSFETTFLKRWLAARGGRITVRTRISRERFRFEQIPRTDPQIPQIPQISQISQKLLENFDLVLIDGTTLGGLSASESAALWSAVNRDGLGVLVTADVRAAGESRLVRDLVVGVAGEEEWSLRPEWRDAPRRSPVAIAAEPVILAGQALVRDGQDRVLAASRAVGSGRVAVTLLKTPSRWMMEGEHDLYGSYWQLLLTAVARDTVTRVSLPHPGARRIDQPMTLSLIIPLVEASPRQWPAVTILSPGRQVDTLAFARDPVDPRLWRATYWPTAAGWHTLQLAGGRSVPFRVSHAGEWVGLDAAARRLASASRLGQAALVPPDAGRRVPLQLILFLVVVGLLTWLWVEPRVR